MNALDLKCDGLLKKLKQTFTTEQDELFNEWYKYECELTNLVVIENRTKGLQEGIALARELLQQKTKH